MNSCVGCLKSWRLWGRTIRKVCKVRRHFSSRLCLRYLTSSLWGKAISKIHTWIKTRNKTTPTTPLNPTSGKTSYPKTLNNTSPNSLSIISRNPSQEWSTKSHSTRTVPIVKKIPHSCQHPSKVKGMFLNRPKRMLRKSSTSRIPKLFNSSLPSLIR